jgi:hypothetical protein
MSGSIGRGAPPLHDCPAPGCHVRCASNHLACRPHWYQLPKAIRDDIWRHYVPGQTAATMSQGYREALAAAGDYWAEHNA